MSYDIWLEAEIDPDKTIDVGNYTCNVSPMWDRALGGGVAYSLQRFENCVANWAVPQLESAIETMKQHPEIYRAMTPENKWGSYEGALEYLEKFLDACKNHPNALIRVSW